MIVQSINADRTKYRGCVFNTASNIESNILLNKGMTDLGGLVAPQAIMANNKDESFERVFKSILYFAFTFVSPFVLLPLINKKSLSSTKGLKNLNKEQRKILQVSKEYLGKDSEYLKEGVKKAAKDIFGDENKFNPTLEKYDNLEDLRKDLINSHTKIHAVDFLATNLLVASIPWLGNAFTKSRTNRSGYSGTYKMADEEFTKKAVEKHDKTKKLRQAATIALAILPAITIPPLLRKGMLKGNSSPNKILKWCNKNAKKFDYKDSIYMSRLTALSMWVTSDYFPYQLACRDKYEYRDTAIRGTSIGLVFWGGDLLLKRGFSKISDKLFGTKLMNKAENCPYSLKELKYSKNIEELKNLSEKTLAKTRKAGVGLYALNLLTIMATLGFGLPVALNKLLKKRVSADKGKTSTNKASIKNIQDIKPDEKIKLFFLSQNSKKK